MAESRIKVLNLYAGIGGNRKLWKDVDVTAVEINPEIAKIYKDFFPEDEVIVGDAHQYLLEHYKEFDFIWSSPPCPTHSRVRIMAVLSDDERNNHPSFNAKYPNMKLYEEIIFLKHHFKGKWVVENVVSYYDPLIKPFLYGSHYYWSNFVIDGKKRTNRCHNGTVIEKQKRKGFDLSIYKLENSRKDQVLRNCVEPEAGLYIFDCAFKEKQITIGDLNGRK